MPVHSLYSEGMLVQSMQAYLLRNVETTGVNEIETQRCTRAPMITYQE